MLKVYLADGVTMGLSYCHLGILFQPGHWHILNHYNVNVKISKIPALSRNILNSVDLEIHGLKLIFDNDAKYISCYFHYYSHI